MKSNFYILCAFSLCFTPSGINAQSKTNAVTYANTSLSNLTSPTSINQSLLVDKDNSHNIGSISKGWKNIYLDSAVYLGGYRFLAFKSGTGSHNTAAGANALLKNTYGLSNTALGYFSLYSNTSGYSNVAIGANALYSNISGNNLVAVGDSALYNQGINTNGLYGNTALGSKALFSNTTGAFNTATGINALYLNVSGVGNNANGYFALYNNSIGDFNTGIGLGALYANTSGQDNTAIGDDALENNATGNYNVALGSYALNDNTSADDNAAVGYNAGYNVTDGINNTFIGSYANCGSGGHLTNSTAIGYNVTVTTNNTVRIGNSDITSIGGYTNWSNVSDGRIKKNIKQNVPGLAFINKLNPITYNLDLDAADNIINPAVIKDKSGKNIQPSTDDLIARSAKEKIIYTGFVAQDVEKAAKELNYDFSGVDKPGNANTLYGLRYSDFVVPLVKAVQELSKQNDELKNENNKQQAINVDLQDQINTLKAMMVSSRSTITGQSSTASFLFQNVPNPFTNTTTINYSLPQQFSLARIIITDKTGSVLKQINLSANKGSVNVDASTLSSGAYQYSLYVDGKMITSKQMEHIK